MVAEKALKKLRNKLLVINLISLTLVIATAFSIIYLNFYSRTQTEIERSMMLIPRNVFENAILSSQTLEQSSIGDSSPGDVLILRGEARIPVDYTKSFVVNITQEGEISVFSMLNLEKETYVLAIETVMNRGLASGETDFAGRSWKYNLEQSPSHDPSYLYSIVFLDIDGANRRLGELAASLIVIGFIAIGVILMISMLLANRAIRPIEDSMARQRRFVADASHELKTPIAVIAANAEAASGGIGEPDGINHWINNIADEANRMNELVENLLALSKAGEKEAELSGFDLVAAVNEEMNRIEVFMFEKEISFSFQIIPPGEETLTVVSDKTKVQAVVSVLLENAMKYTPAGGSVTVTVSKDCVSVMNTGEFIPSDQLPHLFDRFYRADPSRNSENGGHGIGLSLAKEISGALGGELTATSVPQSEDTSINTFSLTLRN